MKKRILGILSLVGLLAVSLFFLVTPTPASAAQDAVTPAGSKTFSPVGIDTTTNAWNDGVPLQGTYLKYDSDGLIWGFAQRNGADWNGQKFKTADGALAYCLNFDQETPNGSSSPLDDLSATQKKQLSNLLKLGYVEHGTDTYKGAGVSTLSNIDAFIATQWMVHKIVPTDGINVDDFDIVNPTLNDAMANLKQWVYEDLDIQLQKDGSVTDKNGQFTQNYELTAPHDLQGQADITLSKDVTGAQVKTADGTSSEISSTKGVNVKVSDKFSISVPDTTADGSVDVVANGGTDSYTFAKYDRPATNQQQALVVGDKYVSDDQKATDTMSWKSDVEKPTIGTTATSDGNKTITQSGEAKIVDQVQYKGLTVGKAYTVKGTLMDKATGNALQVNGKQVTGSTTFTPTSSAGSVNVAFTFDASALNGKQVVAFESLLQDGKVVISHEDINDSGQTVAINLTQKPSIGTTAVDGNDGDKVINPTRDTTIVDRVTFHNLTPGKTYTVKGVLMDKTTGNTLKVDGQEITGSTTFTPEAPNGIINVQFTFNASSLRGKDIVVFETLYHNGNQVTSHADINDNGQTVIVSNPTLQTTATDASDGDKSVDADSSVTVQDRVQYTNLTPGKSYTVSGILMDKETGNALLVNGKEVAGSTTFTPTSANGYVYVDFTFDASGLAGKQLVVFENLYQDGKEIATHADINDASQTVTVPDDQTPTSEEGDGVSPNTPDVTNHGGGADTITGNTPATTLSHHAAAAPSAGSAGALPQTNEAKATSLVMLGLLILAAVISGALVKRRES
ncbi:VaFE repeat-containing surface-anchored protein [Levilactobacillus yonginensis]|uniref:VaFE repeat-containing surface-anchored protein n=1 Tax=Levilactobacillus yonginensis TaxID=1054041 RepID=UPI00345D3B05